jgi:hypothetical protein
MKNESFGRPAQNTENIPKTIILFKSKLLHTHTHTHTHKPNIEITI